MGFLEEMATRGMIAQITHEDEFRTHLATGKRVAYIGFDPTAPSLHIGHLIPAMALRAWQRHGHKAIGLAGGGTAMIGDPSGKTDMRQMLTVESIDANLVRIKQQLGRIIDLSRPDRGETLNNADWLRQLDYLPFLREIGMHFSVNRMLTADCFKQRMEKGLSFLEFNYMILQGYDFFHLHKAHQCSLQMGGDDQWSNILAGMDLIRRKSQQPAFCLTVPLLVNSAGLKMGKTEKGAVWLAPDMTAPFEFFQFFRNMDDDMVGKCLNYFTELPQEEIGRLTALKDQAINEAKVVLAYEVTKLIHGEEAANKAKAQASSLFVTAKGDDDGDAPIVEVSLQGTKDPIGVIDLVVAAGLFPTKSEVRRMIQQGGLALNGEKVESNEATVSHGELAPPRGVMVRKGKKHYHRLIGR